MLRWQDRGGGAVRAAARAEGGDGGERGGGAAPVRWRAKNAAGDAGHLFPLLPGHIPGSDLCRFIS